MIGRILERMVVLFMNSFLVSYILDIFISKMIKHRNFMFDYRKSKDNPLFTLENFCIRMSSEIDLGVDYQVYVKLDNGINKNPELLEDFSYMLSHPLRWLDLPNICVNTINDKDYINDYFINSYNTIKDRINKEEVMGNYYPISVEVFVVESKWYFEIDWVRVYIYTWLEENYF